MQSQSKIFNTSQRVLQLTPMELGLLGFGRLDTDNRIREHVVEIDDQEFLPRATWRQLNLLVIDDLPINEADFVRMWKTLIFKRVLDVYEQQNKTHPDGTDFSWHHRIRVPAPLGDLLYSLGSYFDEVEGVSHRIIPPPSPPVPEPWRTLDLKVLRGWLTMVDQLSSAFLMKEYPPMAQCKGTALIHCTIQDNAVRGTRCIKSRFKGPTAIDAYIRFLNDELFGDPYEPIECAFTMTESMNRSRVTAGYLDRYCYNGYNT